MLSPARSSKAVPAWSSMDDMNLRSASRPSGWRAKTGGVTRPAMFDVTDAEAVDKGLADVESAWGTPDILVNNAGLQRRAPLTEFSVDDWHDVVRTNLTSAFLMSRRVRHGA